MQGTRLHRSDRPERQICDSDMGRGM